MCLLKYTEGTLRYNFELQPREDKIDISLCPSHTGVRLSHDFKIGSNYANFEIGTGRSDFEKKTNLQSHRYHSSELIVLIILIEKSPVNDLCHAIILRLS